MVICFDANTEAKRALDALILTGQFKDTSEAISTALISYEAIQRTVTQQGRAGIHGESAEKVEAVQNISRIATSVSQVKIGPIGPQIPELFFLNSTSTAGLRFASMLPLSTGATSSIPPGRWLFGQYNKFLPAKASCRALLNLMRQKPSGVVLSEAVEAISQAAWELGDYLFALDGHSKRAREDSFAAAFPTTASNGAVSCIRFANQFVGDLRQPKQAEGQPKETKFNGFPAALKFLRCSDGKSPILELTSAGAEFALLLNPIFDGSHKVPSNKFNESEIEFLLAHIARFVPEEASAYISIIEGIEHGAKSPDHVDKFLCEQFHLQVVAQAVKENEITKTFLTTQRTGAISRMVDLGLVARVKEGLRVTYNVTQLAKSFRSQMP